MYDVTICDVAKARFNAADEDPRLYGFIRSSTLRSITISSRYRAIRGSGLASLTMIARWGGSFSASRNASRQRVVASVAGRRRLEL